MPMSHICQVCSCVRPVHGQNSLAGLHASLAYRGRTFHMQGVVVDIR